MTDTTKSAEYHGDILEAHGITKRYPGVLALDAVDFDLRRGEVQALVGQNGAGKSTFVEIVAGSLRPDSGTILLEGKSFAALDPSRSIELGIQTVHQENQLVDELTVAENIYLYALPKNAAGLLDYAGCTRRAQELLGGLGIEVNPRRKLVSLTFIERKLVSIAKAFSRKARILILDEPTASLDEKGKDILFDIIRRNTEKGLSVIYISHNLGEIFEVCDRVTVFKDGRKVSTRAVKESDMGEVVRQMIGRASTTLYNRTRAAVAAGGRELSVEDFSRAGVVDHVSFRVRAGEIFGIGGLVGAGRTELARMMFGLDPKDSGRLVLDGRDLTARTPEDAIRKGIGYLTEDRKGDGLVLGRPIFENVSYVRFAKGRGFLMNLRREKTETGDLSRQLDIKTPSIGQLVVNLSGGNQQKVVLAKWLYAGAEVLIFDEPTVGVDVGAKGEIYRMMETLAAQGKVVLMISSDNPELIAVCDRIGVMRAGRLVGMLEGSQVTEENILRYSMGVDERE
ncbi:MAG TPA: sugar ABC transporter ATP-binding protein [Spirochaetia bacterium]|nr:sugar ABC transporter ATP-binding protein [Spirochaetia bacterium]